MNVVEKMTDLKSLTGITHLTDIADLLGYWMAGDGGGGLFYWDNNSIENDNGGTIIRPITISPANPGRWKRNILHDINVRWFGARGDGVNDDTTMLANAFKLKGGIIIPSGNYLITSTVEVLSDSMISGAGFSSKIFMQQNANGDNLLMALKQENITIKNLRIDGVYNAGVPFPTAGVIQGQGVTLCFGGCRNIVVSDCFFTRNGKGSGNIYLSKCVSATISGNQVEKSENAICIDNYYNNDNYFAITYSKDISIVGNVINDVGGRGVAIDCIEAEAIGSNITISANVISGAAFSGIQCNARNVIIEGNIVFGKRDAGLSTVGGQQSLPTYHGFFSDLGCEAITLANNTFFDVCHFAIKINSGRNITIANNKCSLATEYFNQYEHKIMSLDDVNDKLIFLNWPITDRIPGNCSICNNEITNLRTGGESNVYSELITFNDSTNDSAMAANSDFTIANNRIRAASSSVALNMYRTYNSKTGILLIKENSYLGDKNKNSSFLSCGNFKTVLVQGNYIDGINTAISVGSAETVVCQLNTITNYKTGYYFFTPNIANVINHLILSDTVINDPETWVISGLTPNTYVVGQADGSGLRFINVSVNKIKNTFYPYFVQVNSAATPLLGKWNPGDKIINSTPISGGYYGSVCVVGGNPGTWKQYSLIS